MEIIFLQNVAGVGKSGEVKKVNDGFALNYLIPKQLAVAATPERLKKIADNIKHRAHESKEREKELLKIINRLQNQQLTIKSKSSTEGTLYAAVDEQKIVDAVLSRFGLPVPINSIKLDQHIKKIGQYDILLKLTSTLSTNFKIKVEADNG